MPAPQESRAVRHEKGRRTTVHATSKASLKPTHRSLAERVCGFAFGFDRNAFALTNEQQSASSRRG
jgi:hypothetical protein